MKKTNYDEKTLSLNNWRELNKGKSLTNKELEEALYSLGFNKVVIGYLKNQFPSEKMGTSKLYEVPRTPIHKSIVIGAYEKTATLRRNSYHKAKEEAVSSINEESALALLSSKGYQIRKCVGFDLERFQKENPVLYRKYLKYEIV